MGNSDKTNISMELRFMWYHFNKIKSFIQNGMPNEWKYLQTYNYDAEKELVKGRAKKLEIEKIEDAYFIISKNDLLANINLDNKGQKLWEKLYKYKNLLYFKKGDSFCKVIGGPFWREIKKEGEDIVYADKHNADEHNIEEIPTSALYGWDLNILEDSDVFDAITTFFHFCNWTTKTENASFPFILKESLEISNLSRFVVDYEKPSILISADVLFSQFYNMVVSSTENSKLNVIIKNGNDPNSFESRINKIGKFLQEKLGNDNTCVEKVISCLHLLRKMRNEVCHQCSRKQRFDEIVFALYAFITLFYLIKKYSWEIATLNDFKAFVNSNNDLYSLDIVVDGVSEKHKPFTKINSGGKEIELTLDYQNAEINDGIPVTKEYISPISGFEGVDNGKIIEALRTALNEKNNNDNSVYETLAKITTQSKELLESLNGEEGIRKDLKELQKAISENVTEFTNATEKGLEEYDKEKERKRKRLLICLLCVVIGIAILFFPINWVVNKYAESLYYQTGYEFFLKRAHPDLIYERALALEKEDKTEDACYWYGKAKERYAEVVAENSDQSEAAYRLAQMLIRLKGGSDGLTSDCKKALQYAKIAAKDYGYGLYIYINLLLGNESEARQKMLEIEDGNSIPDDYSNLAGLFMDLFDLGIVNKESMHISDKLVLLEKLGNMCVETNEARQEALVQWYSLLMNGVYINGEYMMGCDFYEAACLLHQNMNNIPLLINYLSYVDMNADRSMLKFALEKLWQNKIQFLYPMIHDYIKGGLVSEPSYMKELSAKIMHVDSLNPLEYMRKAKLSIRHKHLSEETFDYVLYADSLAQLDPFLNMKKNSFLNVFLLMHDSLEVNDLEKLPFKDEKSQALCDYLMGIKYTKGYGVKKDLKRADSYFMSAALQGLRVARYTWAIRLYQQGKIVQAVRQLKPLAEDMDKAKIWMSYILRDLDPQSAEEYLGKVEEFYQPYKVVYALDGQTNVNHEMLKEMHFVLRNSLGESMEYPEKMALLASNLSQISFMLGNWEEAVFYAYWGMSIKAEISYLIFAYLEEAFRSIDMADEAELLFKDMCRVYFRGDGSTLDDNNRAAITYVLINIYPHLINQLTEELGYNPVAINNPNLKPEIFKIPDFSKDLLPSECVLDLLEE